MPGVAWGIIKEEKEDFTGNALSETVLFHCWYETVEEPIFEWSLGHPGLAICPIMNRKHELINLL